MLDCSVAVGELQGPAVLGEPELLRPDGCSPCRHRLGFRSEVHHAACWGVSMQLLWQRACTRSVCLQRALFHVPRHMLSPDQQTPMCRGTAWHGSCWERIWRPLLHTHPQLRDTLHQHLTEQLSRHKADSSEGV